MTITVGTGTAQTITLDSSDNTLAGLASAINSASIGVTAAVVTKSGESTLELTSQTTGSAGALTVSSAITATSDTALSATVTSGSSTVTSSATLTTVAAEDDTLSGSIAIAVGSGKTQTITLDSSDNTLAGLASAINSAKIGVTASVDTAGTALTLTSGTSGSSGSLTVTSSILDTTDTSSTTLSYTKSSDITSLAAMGITVDTDGTISLDATTLDSVLNSDYSGVQALFQNANSWGLTFSSTLTNAGTSSSTGILKLAETAISSNESTLNADITREESLISAETSSLTKELNSANEIMQELPSELSQVNELYSAITGYNESS
jgi:flagellar hook-associated protein 2